MNLNKVHLIGRLTRDPELKALPSGSKVVSFSIATTRVWLDENKAKQEATDFHNLVAFGRQAETLAQYTKKGHLIYLEGRMQTRSWEDESSGKKMYRCEVVVEGFQFAPKAANAGVSEGSQDVAFPEEDRPARAPARGAYGKGGAKKKTTTTKRATPSGGDSVDYPSDDINAEDIPF